MTADEEEVLHWLVQQVREGKLSAEFSIYGTTDTKIQIVGHRDSWTGRKLLLSLNALDSLVLAGMLQCIIDYVVVLPSDGRGWERRAKSRTYFLTEQAYQLVVSP